MFKVASKADSFKDNPPILVNAISVQTWCNRLGHLSPKRLDVFKHVLHFSRTDCSHINPCYVYPLAK